MILFITILSWIFVSVPIIVFMAISLVTMKALMQEDPYVLGISFIGLTLFCVGLVSLLLLYLTDVFNVLVG